jgi:uncharacterized protein YjiS (DUF1127 family)
MTTMDTEISTHLAKRRAGLLLRDAIKIAFDSMATAINMLLDWQERARQRRQLLSLGDRALKDFGANRADAASEGSKPFWRG